MPILTEKNHHYTEVLLNIAKIIGLAAAGFWAWHEWDNITKPNQQAIAYNRQSNSRPDLNIVAVNTQIIRHGVLDVSEASRSYLVELIGVLEVQNSRVVPISMTFESAKFTVRWGTDIQMQQPLQSPSFQNSAVINLNVEEVFGMGNDLEILVEGGGVAQVPFRVPVFLSEKIIGDLYSFEFLSSMTLTAVDPISGELREDVERNKTLHLSGLRFGTRVATNPQSKEEPRSDQSDSVGTAQLCEDEACKFVQKFLWEFPSLTGGVSSTTQQFGPIIERMR